MKGYLAGGLALAALLALTSTAFAQSTNANPVLVVTTTALDPASITTSDSNKKVLADYLGLFKTQGTRGVLAASANLNYLTYYYEGSKGQDTLPDLARVALEDCEVVARAPCIILSINGMDSREPGGGWSPQPEMLESRPGAVLDIWRLPFNTQSDRAALYGLDHPTGPTAIIVTAGAGSYWGFGNTDLDAIQQAKDSCVKGAPNFTCMLYAVDTTVVLRR